MIQRAVPPSGVAGNSWVGGAVAPWGLCSAPGFDGVPPLAPQPSARLHPAKPPPCRAGGPEVTLPAMVPVMHGTPGGTRWAGPELGEHTEQILREELGMGAAEIARLRECGAI